MMNKTDAMKLIENNEAACVVWDENNTYISKEHGVKPLLMWLEKDPEFFRDKNVVDKVIGKAAAMLLIYGNANSVHAKVLSEHALSAFNVSKTSITWDELVDYIINRDKTGMCPMEKRVLNIDSVKEAYINLKSIL